MSLATFIFAAFVLFSAGYYVGLLSTASKHDIADSSKPEYRRRLGIVTNATMKKRLSAVRRLVPSRRSCGVRLPYREARDTVLQRLFAGKSPYHGLDGRSFGLRSPTADPHGWDSKDAVFAELIGSLKPRIVVELGAFLGASAIHMASVARNLSHPTLILSVDDFRAWPEMANYFPWAPDAIPEMVDGETMLMKQFMANVASAGFSGVIFPVPFSTAVALMAMCEWGVYGDLVEVDAGHDFLSAWSDINMAWDVVRPGGGVMFGHDYFNPFDSHGVRRAVDLFAALNGLTVNVSGAHWVMSPKF